MTNSSAARTRRTSTVPQRVPMMKRFPRTVADRLRDVGSIPSGLRARHVVNKQINAQRARWETELASCRSRRAVVSAKINDERCGFDPAESEGSRLAMKARNDNAARIEELRDLLRHTAMPTYRPLFKVREGSIVSLQFGDGRPVRMIVGERSHDAAIEPCPLDTPLGAALLGRRRNATITYSVRGRERVVTIVGLIA
ncbi:hypothetical protein RHCRD62_30368 [Rhodococcus sp. RD6.2]|uniref:GreA/GreB family elongation factor n=1 Tax=Rhodococcus sp. RD6.2 TaxID=260936 RepID=UPI00063B7DE5|nr:GreA/GreB family elongation factor [Rhodococcus sp. RD6.2]CRK51704.1 hypothetical protein RHCRD62_30368 [Rhodococcus sp. RD6.2]